MDEVVLRRVVGVITLAIAAFLLSWLLPRPGLERLRGEGERVVTVDLTRPDSAPQEVPPPSETVEEPTPAPPAAEPAPEPDVVSAPAPTQPAPQPAEKTKPPAPAKPAEPPKQVEPPKPAAEPKPVVPKPNQPAPAAPAAGAGSGRVMVQAGAYSHLDKAEGVRVRASAQGLNCAISPAETPKGTLYRLRCGPYADKAQAQAAVKTLTAAGIAAQVVGGGR